MAGTGGVLVLEIDGAMGEGGGQVLRTALTLSVAVGEPFRISRIRAGRRRPGLQRQHLAAVKAAAAVGAGKVDGAELGSTSLVFEPSGRVPGRHDFEIGSAGSACLVVQTLLPALARCDQPSQVRVVGGTHNRAAPPFEFLARTYLPLLARLGMQASVRLERHGFEPAGGGVLVAEVRPTGPLDALDLVERGPIIARRARALLAGLPRHVGERELAVVVDRLGWSGEELAVEVVEADGPGNVLLLEVASETATEVFTGFGVRGRPAEAVAGDAVAAAQRYLEADVAVGEHLADQLLVPLALDGGGRFVSLPPSTHFTTNAEVIRRFLDVEVTVVPLGPMRSMVEVRHGRAYHERRERRLTPRRPPS